MENSVMDVVVSEDELKLPPRQWKQFWKNLQDCGLLSSAELDAVRKARHLHRDRFLASRKRAAKAAQEQTVQAELASLRSEVAALRAENDRLHSAILATEVAGGITECPPSPPDCFDLCKELHDLF